MLLKKNSTIVFAGDSVTDANRDYAAIPGDFESFGDGYVRIVSAALTTMYPDLNTMVVNAGVNGDDINLLAKRWDQDVLGAKPDYVAILIGINDTWRWFDSTFRHNQNLVTPEKYRAQYQGLIDRTKDQAQVIIMSPFMFELNQADPMRAKLQVFQDIAQELASVNGLQYIDLQATVDKYLSQQSSYTVTKDRVHPKFSGAMLVARKILAALDVDWERSI
ncbi:esterase [Ligilactobacillus salitolerans]|uniref:Esterase n=2 Tax=Ligilactobacillus salitolerans TaxID=1808352 RepID=A0A401IVC7_9LACO|nr:esterase [Ligilactobacillus salitolerans]